MISETASTLEIAYTAPSLGGFILACVLLYLTVGDELERRRVGVNGVVRLDLQKAVVTAAVLVVALGCHTWIGVNSLATPPNPNALRDPVAAATAIQNALLFVTSDVALILLAGYRLLQRNAVLHAMRQEHRRDRRSTDKKEAPS